MNTDSINELFLEYDALKEGLYFLERSRRTCTTDSYLYANLTIKIKELRERISDIKDKITLKEEEK